MARANRHHLPGNVWHITHRCHKRDFLLKFKKDKQRWRDWLFEAKKRFGLSTLNYTITSNHIHLLVYDAEENVIPKSVQLVAGRTAREFNIRKRRKGAFWEDRYHATAVQSGRHLIQCLVYIDLNMVRAGVVEHPCDWAFCGYGEIQHPKQRYSLIDRDRLCRLLGVESGALSDSHRNWIDDALTKGVPGRDGKWSESIAVGDEFFVQTTKDQLGAKAIGRKVSGGTGEFELRESIAPYNSLLGHEKRTLRPKNGYPWKENKVNTVG